MDDLQHGHVYHHHGQRNTVNHKTLLSSFNQAHQVPTLTSYSALPFAMGGGISGVSTGTGHGVNTFLVDMNTTPFLAVLFWPVPPLTDPDLREILYSRQEYTRYLRRYYPAISHATTVQPSRSSPGRRILKGHIQR